jgi:hypothetical protein
MHNMIIESEHKHPPNDNYPYDFQCPLATVDHDVLADFADFLIMHVVFRDADAHIDYKIISLSICGGSKEIRRVHHDVFILFKLYL